MIQRFPLSATMADLVDRNVVPGELRHAASVVLVRQGTAGLEAYLLRRQRSMAFAAGMYVFPGGRVDEADGHADVPWVGPSPQEWAGRLGCSADHARALVCAGVRETFEESGVLLAGPDEHTIVSDTSTPGLQKARSALENHEMTFSSFLTDSGLVLRTDLLGAWSNWITPEFEPKRYDTWFFVAELPAGQSVGELSIEADRAAWTPLTDVLAAVDAGTAAMLPVTQVVCQEVAEHPADMIVKAAADRVVKPISPRLVEIDGQMYLEADT